MVYRDFKGKKLSSLGLGCMRFPRIEGTEELDMEKIERMFDLCMKSGINYYDTAWGYLQGKSEIITGDMLKKYNRDEYCLASKFPGFDKELISRPKEVFEKQLEKCGVEYFDFYLFHNVCEANIDAYLNDAEYGHFSYLVEQKRLGRIKHLGFSTHGTVDTMRRFIEAYGSELEFCQIQLNYLDRRLQAGEEKLALLKEYGLPVWVMEPLRGGKLAAQHEDVEELLSGQSMPSWGFRYLFGIDEVTMILSGMSDIDQIEENVRIFSEHKALDAKEKETLDLATDKLLEKKTLPCTACRYCTDGCPMGLNIPLLIGLYNDLCYSGHSFTAHTVVKSLPDDKKPSSCIGCRACEEACPQNIKISEAFSDFAERLSKEG